MENPSAVVPALARGLTAVRAAKSQLASDADAAYMLGLKEQQFEDAINTALAIEFTAIAQPAAAVPGETFDVKLQWANRSRIVAENLSFAINGSTVAPDPARTATFRLTVPPEMPVTRPYFHRVALSDTRYAVGAASRLRRGPQHPSWRRRPTASKGMGGDLDTGQPARGAAAVRLRHARARGPAGGRGQRRAAPGDRAVLDARQKRPRAGGSRQQRDRGQRGPDRAKAARRLDVNALVAAVFIHATGEKATYRFVVRPGVIDGRDYEIEAIATANGKAFKIGYEASSTATSRRAISFTTPSFACAAWTSGSHRA
jgi:hypothetical protein